MVKNSQGRLIGLICLIGAAAAWRVGEFIPNVAPITALALYAGATLSLPYALAVPLLAMVVSDIFIGWDYLPITLLVYGSFALGTLLGRWLKSSRSPGRILVASVAASSLFFLLTNAAVWWFSGMYERTAAGLLLSYYYGIPFYRNTLAGDVIFTAGLFWAAHQAGWVIHALRKLVTLCSSFVRFNQPGAKKP